MLKQLKEFYLSKKGFMLSHDKYEELREFLIENTKELDTQNLSERLFVLFNKSYVNKCHHCGKKTAFQSSVIGYRKYCSNECKRNHIYTKERTHKMKQTCLKNHGVENPGQSPVIREKMKKTCLKNYGVDVPAKSDIIKSKMKQTCLKNHGVENPGQSNEIKNKIKKTCLDKYGVDHNLKIPDIREAVNQKLRDIYANREFGKFYTYKFPSGKTIRIQGFENIALDELVLKYGESNIKAGRKDIIDTIGHVMYVDNGTQREYFPDIYICDEHKIIEVKSEYTYKLHYDLNIKKKQACTDLGFMFEFWVYDKKMKKIVK